MLDLKWWWHWYQNVKDWHFKMTHFRKKYYFKINPSVWAAGWGEQYLLLIRDMKKIDWRFTEGQNRCRHAKLEKVKHFGEDCRGKVYFERSRIGCMIQDTYKLIGWPYHIFYEVWLEKERSNFQSKEVLCLLLWTSFYDLHL